MPGLEFTTLPLLVQLLTVTPSRLQTLASSVLPSVASTVIVIPAYLALAFLTKRSLDRPELRVSPGLLPTAAQFLLPIRVSSIPLSLASMGREMLGPGVPVYPMLS